jgi:hypothetical protein
LALLEAIYINVLVLEYVAEGLGLDGRDSGFSRREGSCERIDAIKEIRRS